MNDYFVRYLLGSIINEDVVNCFNEVHNFEIINLYNLHKNINLKESVFDIKGITKDNKKIIIKILNNLNVDNIKKNKILSFIKAV